MLPQAACGAPAHTTVTCCSQVTTTAEACDGLRCGPGPGNAAPSAKEASANSAIQSRPGFRFFSQDKGSQSGPRPADMRLCAGLKGGCISEIASPRALLEEGADAPLLKAPFVYGSAGRAIEPLQGDNTLATHPPLSECSECSS